MKLNKKIIIPAFTLLVGTALAGSVASTVAWYQYSTRTNVSYIGTSAGTIGNLQLRIRDYNGHGSDWGTNLSIDDVANYLSSKNIGQKVEQVTSGPLAKDGFLKKLVWEEVASNIPFGEGEPDDGTDKTKMYLQLVQNEQQAYTTKKLYAFSEAANAWQEEQGVAFAEQAPNANAQAADARYVNLQEKSLYKRAVGETNDFYLNPQIGMSSYNTWIKATKANYVTIPLQLRFIEGDEDHLTAEDVYLSKLLIQKDTVRDNDSDDHGDLSDAIRVHFSAYKDGDENHAVNHLVSRNGGTTVTHGRLKLGNGYDYDKAYEEGDEFGFSGTSYDYVYYGGVDGEQVSYSANTEETVQKYYEEDDISSSVTGWQKITAVSSGAGEKTASEGTKGDFYIQILANSKKLFLKQAGSWAEITDIASGDELPVIQQPDQPEHAYFFKTDDNTLHLYSEDAWHDVAIVDTADSASDPDGYPVNSIYSNSSDNKFYIRRGGLWEEKVIASSGIGDPTPGQKGQNTIGDYYVSNTNDLFGYVGAPVYEETVKPAVVGYNGNVLTAEHLTQERKFGTTVATHGQNETQKYLNVDVTIWVEGWQKYERNGSYTSLWDRNLIDAMFDVGFQFAVQDR